MANSVIHSTFSLGATAHLTNNTIIKITWKNDEPIWTEQWPLTKEKLQAAKELIDTQLELKHIEESCSPWTSLIFVIKKKSNKWHLLTDLSKVNTSMKPMGALQPRIPSPTTIPQNWHIIIIDLQDCFLKYTFTPFKLKEILFLSPLS